MKSRAQLIERKIEALESLTSKVCALFLSDVVRSKVRALVFDWLNSFKILIRNGGIGKDHFLIASYPARRFSGISV